MTDVNPSKLWALAAVMLGEQLGTPLPEGISNVSFAGWDWTINNSNETVDDMGPFQITAEHKNYIRFAVMDPTGGSIAGYTEDQLIADLEAEGVSI